MIMNMDYALKQGFKTYLNAVQTMKNTGYLIGKWLVTGATDDKFRYFRVYNCYGYPVTDLQFSSFDDVNKFAEFLVKHYQDYFELWKIDPQFDIPQMTQYTIKDGVRLNEIFHKLSDRIVSFKDVENELSN